MTKRDATIRATKEAKPRQPKADSGEVFETLIRQMFAPKVDKWCKDNLDEMPDKEARASVVDNLTASFTSGFETLADGAVDSYLSTATDDDDVYDEVECPECKEVVEIPEDDNGDLLEPGDKMECPECHKKFKIPEPPDDSEDVDEGEGATDADR